VCAVVTRAFLSFSREKIDYRHYNHNKQSVVKGAGCGKLVTSEEWVEGMLLVVDQTTLLAM